MYVTSMGQSMLGWPNPSAGAPNGDRRRSVRQKLHTPVYATFNGPETGMVVDLSELLDLHEDGFAVQTSERLETNRAVTLCLDLPETKSYIHSSGQVMWSDDAGRGGIRFSGLSESSRQILKEWLFANLLIACGNHAARTEQRAWQEEEKSPELVHESVNVVPISDGSGMLFAVEAVRREVRGIGDDVEATFRLITARALSLTGASGAALAFLTEDKMICRAQAGEPTPPLGAVVDVEQGLSGECVRNGLPVWCEDMENDPRVDPEIGRALGIGSLMAAPIVSDFRVVGLLEAFSPQPHGFAKVHGTVLDRLVEMIPKTHGEKTQPEAQPENAPSEAPVVSEAVFRRLASELSSTVSGSIDVSSVELGSIHATREALWEQKPDIQEQVSQRVPRQAASKRASEAVPEPIQVATPTAPSYPLHWVLFGVAILVVFLALGYLLGPIILKRLAESPQSSQPSAVEAASNVPGQVDPRTQARSLADLRNLADHGDADAQWQ